jgi:MoaA/NifB/PqqE/SkfB family radical SAM enzyme
MTSLYRLLPRILGTHRAIRAGQLALGLRNWLKYGDRHFFHDVAIEIQTHCNRRCWYCPQSSRPAKRQDMSWDTFRTVVLRLKAIQFVGNINFSIFNEPLLDERLVHMVNFVNTVLPRAFPLILTNGDLLTPERTQGLINAGVTRIIVTEHPPARPGWADRISLLAAGHPNIIRVQRLTPERLRNNGGLTQLPGLAGPFTNPCYPRNNLVVRFNGDVGICCCDYQREITVGNLLYQDILQVWRGHEYLTLRRELARGIRTRPICVKCSGGYHP